MTIITSCPHCKTAFNVADSILSKYKGFVRCASCSKVFNAIENEIKKNNIVVDDNNKENIENIKKQTKVINNKVSPLNLNTTDIKKEQSNSVDSSSNSNNVLEQQSMPQVHISIFEKLKRYLPFLNKNIKNKDDSNNIELKKLADNTHLNKRLNKLGDYKKKRPLFMIINSVLVVLVFFQVVYWQKNNIANAMPSISPALKLFAKIFGGNLAPLKLKDNPVVSFSDMQKDLSINANRYILNVGLQNRYNGEAAMPSLEISLFDLNEQIITRRVFHPQTFINSTDWKRLEKYGLRANEELPIKLKFETNQAISSFKVVVFYP